MKHYPFLTLLCVLLAATSCTRITIDLSGEWAFAMGEQPVYDDRVSLPGSMPTNGKGHDVAM